MPLLNVRYLLINTSRNITIRTFSSSSRRRRKAPSRRPHDTRQTIEKHQTQGRLQEQVHEMILHNSSSNFVDNAAFVARDTTGKELSMNEYLQFASLSPWVPCPDPVAIRALDIAKVSSTDIHYELGCGDGRMNFHAIDTFYNVKKSVGIDIDPSLVERSNHRKARIYPPPEHLQFLCADLIDMENRETVKIWNLIQKECTILTMYFVEDALLKMKEIMEDKLLGSKCKVITIGYPVHGWEPMWVEVLLGLKIHMYDMSNVDHLYNRSVPFDTEVSLQSEEILNVQSKEKLRAMQEEDNHPTNPFRAPRNSGVSSIGNSHGDDDEEEDDGDNQWDFDENIEYDEHGNKR